MALSKQYPPTRIPQSTPPVIPPALPLVDHDLNDDQMPKSVVAAIAAGVAILFLLLVLLIMLFNRNSGANGIAENGIATDNIGESMASNPAAKENGTASSDGKVDAPAEETEGQTGAAESGDAGGDSLDGEVEFPVEGESVGTIDWEKEEGDLFANSGTQGIGTFTQSGVKMFGIEGEGRNIVYIVDRSSSMAAPVYRHDLSVSSSLSSRFDHACSELIQSVNGLKQNQVFTILFFNDGVFYDANFVAASPTAETRTELKAWLTNVYPDGGTNPIPAVATAFDKSAVPQVDVIFLLSDGEFQPFAVNQIKSMNSTGVVIHTISMLDNATTLQQIANENGGKFVTAK